MKMMGVDFGTKKVGIALTDESGFYAFPSIVLKNDHSLVKKIKDICVQERVGKIILGESLDYDNQPNSIMDEAEVLKNKLEQEGLEVFFEPEHLTSVEADQVIGKDDMTDARAAAIILKSYIDRKQNEDNK